MPTSVHQVAKPKGVGFGKPNSRSIGMEMSQTHAFELDT